MFSTIHYIYHLLILLIYTKMLPSLFFYSLYSLRVFSSSSFIPTALVQTSCYISLIYSSTYPLLEICFCHTFFTWYYPGIANFRFVPLSHKDIIHCAFYRARYMTPSRWVFTARLRPQFRMPAVRNAPVLQSLHGEIGCTNSGVQKRDRQKRDGQTKKNQRFWSPGRRVKSEPHQTWHGDRGPQARSCTSKTFGSLTHSFAARGRWKFGGN